MHATQEQRPETSEIFFDEGIIGVPRARRFELLERAGSSVRLLRSLDIEGFSLPVVDPKMADPDYDPRLNPRITRALELDDQAELLLLAVATLESDGPLVNLRAPLVINAARLLGVQVILEDRTLPLRAELRELAVRTI